LIVNFQTISSRLLKNSSVVIARRPKADVAIQDCRARAVAPGSPRTLRVLAMTTKRVFH